MFSKAFRSMATAGRVLADNKHRIGGAVALGATMSGAYAWSSATAADSTKDTLTDILARVRSIESDLGVTADTGSKFTAADNYPDVPGHSLVKKYLTPEVYEECYNAGATKSGWTIDKTIQCAVDYPVLDGSSLHIGCFAGDEESYELFKPFFKKVIKDYHGFDMDKDTHVTDTNPDHVLTPNPDPEGKYILSTRIRAGRQIRGLSMPANCTRAERREIERLLNGAFANFPEDLKGGYEARSSMTKARHHELVVTKHFLFEDPDSWTIMGNFARDWPDARGIFVSNDEKALVWVNEEDHMRCISMQKGADVKAVFSRWARIVNAVEKHLKANGYEYAIHPRLGALTGCPSNLGTGMRASVHVQLPLLGRKDGFKKMCERMGVQVRGKGGEKDNTFTGVFDLSNISRLGKGEAQLVDSMLQCVAKCIEIEKKLEAGQDVDISTISA